MSQHHRETGPKVLRNPRTSNISRISFIGAVWKSPKDGSWPWKQITAPHNITQIDASENYIYGVDNDGTAWRTDFGQTPWEKIGGDYD